MHPTTRDNLSGGQTGFANVGEWPDASMTSIRTIEHEASLEPHSIEQLGMMRNDDNLRAGFINSVDQLIEPRLNFGKCDKVVWFIQEQTHSWFSGKMK